MEEEVPDEPEEIKEVVQTRTVRRQEPGREEITRRQVYRTVSAEEVPDEPEKKEARKVERVFVKRLIRKPDGRKTLIDESETITPVEAIPTEHGQVEEEKDMRGYIIRKVIRRPIYVTTQRTVIRKLEVMPDGDEKELEKSIDN